MQWISQTPLKQEAEEASRRMRSFHQKIEVISRRMRTTLGQQLNPWLLDPWPLQTCLLSDNYLCVLVKCNRKHHDTHELAPSIRNPTASVS
mmetsp:Transcript_49531/g.78434  ORF Transcript_49531/g.78434 Transcript_49531/m.78434 type:complete len:91 (-) Transcript_49531:1399-1671(-)